MGSARRRPDDTRPRHRGAAGLSAVLSGTAGLVALAFLALVVIALVAVLV